MQPSADHFDEFFQEQLRQLQANGHAPQEAADIFLQAQEAILEACQKLLETPVAQLEQPPGGAETDPDGRLSPEA
jgi:hypothetical protein